VLKGAPIKQKYVNDQLQRPRAIKRSLGKQTRDLEEMKKLGSSPEVEEGDGRADRESLAGDKHFGNVTSKKSVTVILSDGLSDEADFADLEY